MATREGEISSSGLSVSIEPMTEHDLLEVCDIEEAAGLSTWGWDAYHKELRSPADVIMLVARKRSIGSAVEKRTAVVGFIGSRLVADELHVNNVAVRSEFRVQGIATRLLQTVLAQARGQGVSLAVLEVRAGNEAAQGLYERCGFAVTGRRRNYYNRPVEDALLMSLSLKGSS
jgi:ribosomal-protein-alanine N-acetyltransferase